MTVNHWVTGSSPVGGAIYIKALAFYDAKAFLFGQAYSSWLITSLSIVISFQTVIQQILRINHLFFAARPRRLFPQFHHFPSRRFYRPFAPWLIDGR